MPAGRLWAAAAGVAGAAAALSSVPTARSRHSRTPKADSSAREGFDCCQAPAPPHGAPAAGR